MDQRRRIAVEPMLLKSSLSIGALASAAGFFVLNGWVWDVAALRSLIPGSAEMKFNAAVAFLAAGVSLCLLATRGNERATAARVCAIVAAAIGILTLSQYWFDWTLGIDELLYVDRAHDGPHPGRIPPASAVSFVLLGAALAMVDVRVPAGRSGAYLWPTQWLALAIALISFVVLLGYIYDAASIYHPLTSSPVVLPSAFLFMLLSLGVLLARPDRGLIAHMSAADGGGAMLRRLLPAVVVVSPILGWLRLEGQEAGFYAAEIGIAIFATANVLILALLVWNTASVVRRADSERQAASQRVHGQMTRLGLLSLITHAIAERQDLPNIFRAVIGKLGDYFPIDFGCVCLYDAATQTMSVASVSIHGQCLAAELAMPEQTRIAVVGNALASCLHGALIYEPDVGATQLPLPKRLLHLGMRSLVFAPLHDENAVFGVVVCARRKPDAFTRDDREFLRQLSEHVALAARQAQLYESLQHAYDDLRQSQKILTQQERLRVLGQMASGIAHDINNALSPMTLYTESLLENEPGLSPRGRKQLETISRAVDDVAHTVARMREFYRPQEAQPLLLRLDFNRIVRQVVERTRARWRDLAQERGVFIDLRTDLSGSLPGVMGEETEIRDALTNLIFNAVDAMPLGGVLTISTAAIGVEVRARSRKGGATHVCVAVGDTGVGMDEETQRRCLEPFFTTKGERGTGLGLAMVYGMAQRHDAELEIESIVGSGSTVRLIFPVATKDAPSMARPISSLVPRAHLRILLIDDDPLLMQSLRDTLEGDGHFVRAVDGGQAGIDEFRAGLKSDQPFAAVITDLGMPCVDGRKVAAAIRAMAPLVPIILLTGWGQRMLAENDIPQGVDRVLAKPPKLSELRAALAEFTSQIELVSASGVHDGHASTMPTVHELHGDDSAVASGQSS